MKLVPGKLYKARVANHMARNRQYCYDKGSIFMFVEATSAKSSFYPYALIFLLPSGKKKGYVSTSRDRLVQNGTDITEELFTKVVL